MTLADLNESILLTAQSNVFQGFASVAGALRARANVGILSASVEFDVYAQNSLHGLLLSDIALAEVSGARAMASWRDSATITVPGLPQGFPLLVPARIIVTGSNSVPFPDTPATGCCGFGYTTVIIRFIDGTLIDNGGSLHYLPAQDDDSDFYPDTTNYELLQFENGVPRDIGFILQVSATGKADRGPVSHLPGSVTTRLTADYYATLKWAGIAGVFNAATEEPVDNWTITSESGFDYSRPYGVPEPATILLLASGLAWLWSARVVRWNAPLISCGELKSRTPA
jgi:hypothetical protein